MPDPTFILAVLSRTPTWVWGLFAALLALGLSQTVTRRVPRMRLVLLPLTLLGIGIWGLSAGFADRPLAALLWLAAVAGFAQLGMRLPTPAGARWLPGVQRLQLPGSWLPLLLIVAIFVLRYSAAVAQVLHPEWRPALLLPLALAYGAISGIFVGRAVALLRLTRDGIDHGSLRSA